MQYTNDWDKATRILARFMRGLLEGDREAQRNVKEPQRLLRDTGDVDAMIKEQGDIKPYVDPVLSSSRRHHIIAAWGLE